MKSENYKHILKRLQADLAWRMDEYRLSPVAARLLEIQREIRQLQNQIEYYQRLFVDTDNISANKSAFTGALRRV